MQLISPIRPNCISNRPWPLTSLKLAGRFSSNSIPHLSLSFPFLPGQLEIKLRESIISGRIVVSN
ncbi:hypothetical protein GYH30_003685 [Glycine max]|nr:hypothetical protein GYH30_003685 [Glycine max]